MTKERIIEILRINTIYPEGTDFDVAAQDIINELSPSQTGGAEEVLSKHTGETGIYLTKGMVRGSDALEAMEEYANIKTAVYRNMVYRLAEEMRRSEWDSPVYEEAKQLLNK